MAALVHWKNGVCFHKEEFMNQVRKDKVGTDVANLLYVSALALMLTVVMAGCANAKSDAIASREIYAIMSVSGNSANRVGCHATLRVGGENGTFIDLSGEDTLVCSDGTNEFPMEKNSDSITGMISYSYDGEDLVYAAGGEYKIIFRRPGENHVSSTNLPQAVSLSAPLQGSNHQKGTALPVGWNGASGSVLVSLTHSLTSGVAPAFIMYDTEDDGSYSFSADDTRTRDAQGNDITGTLSATVSVTRRAVGSLASGLKGGLMLGAEIQSAQINLVD